MSQPQRIQRKRTKGWKAPEGAVYVGRPTKWGNPFPVSEYGRAEAVGRFQTWLRNTPEGRAVAEAARNELRGKNLMCWCGKGPCHADELLRVANWEANDG